MNKNIVIITAVLMLFFIVHPVTWAGCTITTPNVSVTMSAIMPTVNNLDPYVITFSCDPGTSYTISHVSPTPTSGGFLYLRRTDNTSKYFYLVFYRDAARTDAVRPANLVIKSGTATGEQETAVLYPQLRVVSSFTSECVFRNPNYFCRPGTASITIQHKIVF